MREGQAPRLSWRHCLVALVVALLSESLFVAVVISGLQAGRLLANGVPPSWYFAGMVRARLMEASAVAIFSALPLLAGLLVLRHWRFAKMSSFLLMGGISLSTSLLLLLAAIYLFGSGMMPGTPMTALLRVVTVSLYASVFGAVAGWSAWYYLRRCGELEKVTLLPHPETNF